MRILYQCFVVAILVSAIQGETFSATDYRELLSLMFIYPKINKNLTENVIPISYKVKLNTDFDNSSVMLDGNAEININVIKSTDIITLRARNLIIKPDAHLKCDDPTDVAILTIEPIDKITELFKIHLTNKLHVGSNCNLTFSYTRENITFSTPMSQFTGQLGNTTWTLVSQNIACDVFPCSPDRTLKANCTISIEHSKNYVAISHMDAMNVEVNSENPERVITHFAESPKIYPLQFVFAIGDFIKTQDHNKEVQVSATRGFPINLNYTQELGTNIVKALGNYTGVSYETFELKKLNLIMGEIPITSIGIAYHGIILIKMTTNLMRFENSNLNSQTVLDIQTMAHEMAHQWLISLVHRSTFGTTWFFEGIPEYLSYVVIDQIESTWRMMDQFIIDNLLFSSFEYDSSVHNPHIATEDINIMMNTPIVYSKSSCIIRMISHVLGEENFKIALRNFIKIMTSEVITTDVFIKELSKVYTGNINLTDALSNWVNLPGYPVINVKRDYDTGKAIITQTRFLDYDNPKYVEKYWIPINFVTEDNLNFMDTNVTHWFNPSMNSIEINQLKKDQFVIFNKQLFGYYRVNYDNQNWKLIINYLNSENYSRIHVLNRVQLISDVYNFAMHRQIDYEVMWSLFEYLKRETDFVPWSVAWEAIKTMYQIVVNSENENEFKNYVLELSKKLENEVLSVHLNETHFRMKNKRKETLKWTCLFGSRSCISEATMKFINWLDDPEKNALSTDEKDWIICAALRNADQELWDKAWDKYKITNDPAIKSALTCTLNVTILKKYLSKCIPDKGSVYQIELIFSEILSNNIPIGATVIVDYIIEHYNTTNYLNGDLAEYQELIFETLIYNINDKLQCDKLRAFIEDNKASIPNATEIVADIDEYLEIFYEDLRVFKSFFKKYITINSDNSSSSLSKIIMENNK